jgi:hypothetical protein
VGLPDSIEIDHEFLNDLTIDGFPDTFHIDIQHIPKIQVGVDPLNVTLKPITVEPLDVSVRLKEIPSIRTHLPADFTVGFSVLGLQLFCVRLCGEAQAIMEPFHPNPCEMCGAPVRHVIAEPPPAAVAPPG